MKLSISKLSRAFAMYERRSRLKNKNFSIISNTCIGGVIYNSLGEKFCSPTINMVIYEEDFINFCRYLKEYSKIPVDLPNDKELKEFPQVNYPVGIIHGGEYPDIKLLFVHYNSFEEAKLKWEERFKRVNYDNIFIIMDRELNAKDEILDNFYSLEYKNKVFFTDKPSSSKWNSNFNFSYYTKDKYFANCLYEIVNVGIKQYRWLDEFDYVSWLNSGIIKKSNYKIFK